MDQDELSSLVSTYEVEWDEEVDSLHVQLREVVERAFRVRVGPQGLAPGALLAQLRTLVFQMDIRRLMDARGRAHAFPTQRYRAAVAMVCDVIEQEVNRVTTLLTRAFNLTYNPPPLHHYHRHHRG